MSGSTLLKLAWVGLVFAAIAAVSFLDGTAQLRKTKSSAGQATAGTASITILALAHGKQGIADAGGYITPLRDYRRIASAGTIADQLLIALAEPERIAAVSRYGKQHERRNYLYGQRLELSGPNDIETLRAQHIELLLLNHLGAPAELARVRDAGIEVFNLGEMRGLETLPKNIEAVAMLLGDRNRGVRVSAELQRRMRAVAADIPSTQRKQALYVSAYAGQLFGGAAHTSYHDVLTAAGLIDVATPRFRDWPHYDPEQLLMLDPELIITSDVSVAQFCQVPGLVQLRACKHDGGVLGFSSAALGDPGLGMLDIAEEIRERVYGPMH